MGFFNIQVNAPIGMEALDFSLENEKGETWRLSEHRGRVVALLFYPRDETLVCTRQLCSVRDNWQDYVDTKAVVVGISRGTVAEHASFVQRHHLPLHLLADMGGLVTRAYCRHQWMPVWMTRAIVVVDAKGIIRHHKVMSRARRPTDYKVLSQIYAARTDASMEKSEAALEAHRELVKRVTSNKEIRNY